MATPFVALQAQGVASALLTGGLGSRSLITRGIGAYSGLLAQGYLGAFVVGGGQIAPPAVGTASSLVLGGLRSRGLLTRGLGNYHPLTAAGGPGPYVATPLAAPVTLPTDLATISAALRRRLLLANLVASPGVIFARQLQPYPAAGYPQIVLCRGDFRPIDAHRTGGGRFTGTFEGVIQVAVNTLSAADEQGQDAIRLLGKLAPPTALTGTAGSTTDPNGTIATTDPPADAPALGAVPAGLETIVHQLLDLVTTEFVEDAAGNHLTVEPVTLASNARPIEYGDFPKWGGIALGLRVVYLARLTTTTTAGG